MPPSGDSVDLRFDPTSGDLALTPDGTDIAFTRGAEAIAQGARLRFALGAGEWFLNTSEGIPYLQSILVMGARLTDLRVIFRRALALVPGVATVESLSLQKTAQTRRLAVNWRVRAVDGSILNSGAFEPFVVTLPREPLG